MKRAWAAIAISAAIAALAILLGAVKMGSVKDKRSVEERLAEFGAAARGRMAPHFSKASVAYPPAKALLVALKEERRLELWAASGGGPLKRIAGYGVLGASGESGPKLREGDRQVPEGLYKIELLNPNSRFHVSLRLDYPNEFDRRMGELDGRKELGSDIMIHGSDRSIGCLAMGDEAAEELFTLASDAGIENVSVVICPLDFRKPYDAAKLPGEPRWVSGLYEDVKAALPR